MTSQKKSMSKSCGTSVWLLPLMESRDSVTLPAPKPKAGSTWQGTVAHTAGEAQLHAGHVTITEMCSLPARPEKAPRAPPLPLPPHLLCQVWLAPAATISDTTAALASSQAEPVEFTKGDFIRKYHRDFLAVKSSSAGLLCCKGIISLLFFIVWGRVCHAITKIYKKPSLPW